MLEHTIRLQMHKTIYLNWSPITGNPKRLKPLNDLFKCPLSYVFLYKEFLLIPNKLHSYKFPIPAPSKSKLDFTHLGKKIPTAVISVAGAGYKPRVYPQEANDKYITNSPITTLQCIIILRYKIKLKESLTSLKK